MIKRIIVTIFILYLPVTCYSDDIIVGEHFSSHSSWSGSGPVEVEQSYGKYIGKIRLAEGKTLVHLLLKEKLTPLELDQVKTSFQVRGKMRPASIQISCRIVKMDGSIQEWPMAKDWDVQLNTWSEFETPVNGPDVKYFRNVLCTKARKKGMAFMSPAPIKKISLIARVKSVPEDGLWLLWKPVRFSKRTHKIRNGDPFCPDRKVHRVLLIRKAADGFTHFAETIKNLGHRYQLSKAKVVSQQFGIPVLDDAATLAKQRLIVIKDMDSALFTPEQVQVIKDYVEAGGSLLIMAGPANMEKSLFPVRFEGYPAWKLVKPANNVPNTTVGSKIKAADIGFLRSISWNSLAKSTHIARLRVQKTAETLLSIGETPVLVKKSCGKGMVMVFTAYPNWEISDNFFLGDEYKKFLSGMIAHLCNETWIVPAVSPSNKAGSPVLFKLHLPFGVDYACPAHPFRFQAKVHSSASAKDCKLHCKVTDAKGEVIHRFPASQIGDGEIIKFKWDVPMLTSGKYRLSMVLRDEKGRGLYSEDKNLYIGPWIDNTSRFKIIGYMDVYSKGLLLDPTEIDIQLDDLQVHGFNTVSVPLANRFSPKEGSIVSRMQNYAIRGALMRGMGIVNDLNTDFLPFLGNPAAIPSQERISPLSQGYQSALAKKLEDALAYQSHIPCLIDVSYWDEAAMNFGFLCRSQFCADDFHKQMGYHLPSNIINVKKNRMKREIHHFFSDLYAREHAAVTHLAYDRVPGMKLRHIFCSRGAGNGAFTRRVEDPIKWTESGDIISYDSYAYFYPASYKPRYRFAALHWVSAFFRNLALARGMILENYVELDDRNHKYVVSPKEASSENAYLALAQGANRINTFVHRYGLNNMSRRERWNHLGFTLNEIKKIGPLWKNYNRQPSQVAVLFGFHQWLAESYYRPMYAYETILQAFGGVDIIQERLLATRGTGKRKVIFLLGIDYLSNER